MPKKVPPKVKEKIIKSWAQALPDEGIIMIFGHKRQGKSGTAWSIAEKLQAKGKPVATFLFPKKGRHLVPDWVKHVYSVQDLKKLRHHLIIADEMALHAYARDHESDLNKELNKLMAITGQAHQLLILICQHTRQLDVGLVMEPDLIYYKRPSLLHIRFARPELKPEIQEAWDLFDSARGNPKSWVFIMNYHNGYKGFLRTTLPKFWSEDLSEVYSRYELESLEKEKKKKKKNTGKTTGKGTGKSTGKNGGK